MSPRIPPIVRGGESDRAVEVAPEDGLADIPASRVIAWVSELGLFGVGTLCNRTMGRSGDRVEFPLRKLGETTSPVTVGRGGDALLVSWEGLKSQDGTLAGGSSGCGCLTGSGGILGEVWPALLFEKEGRG